MVLSDGTRAKSGIQISPLLQRQWLGWQWALFFAGEDYKDKNVDEEEEEKEDDEKGG